MNLVLTAIVAGLLGTLAMDVLNLLFAKLGLLEQIGHRMLGRVAHGWLRGRFFYSAPSEVPEVDNAMVYGFVTHYVIGVLLALGYLVGWDLLTGDPASPIGAVIYGVGTTVFAYFYFFPGMGLGVCGRLSPLGIKLPITSLLNHGFYGLGVAAGIMLM